MKTDENLFLKHKYSISALFFTFILFLVFYVKNTVGIFFDIPSKLISMLSNFGSDWFVIFHDDRPRFFNNLLAAVPFNIFYLFFSNTKIINILKVFSVSYLIVPLFLLILNYLAAFRTKRYDIAVIAMAFYFLISVPNSIWPINELHMTILCYFILLSYFLSKTKLNTKDIVPVSILLLYLFMSFETVIFIGLIFFAASYFYTKRPDAENVWYKVLIGYIALFSALFIPVKLFFINHFKGGANIFSIFNEWFIAFKVTFERICDGNLIIPLFALLFIGLLFFYKKNLKIKSLFVIIPYLAILLWALGYKTHFIPDPNIELLNYGFTLLLMCPVFIAVFVFDYFNIKPNDAFYSNLIITVCIFGILNLLWQINSSFYFKKAQTYFTKIMQNSEDTIVVIPKEDIDKYSFLDVNTCYGAMARSIFFNLKDSATKIIIPSDYYKDYGAYCFVDPDSTYFDEKSQIIYLQKSGLKVKTKYWDLTNAAEEFRKSGRVKNNNN